MIKKIIALVSAAVIAAGTAAIIAPVGAQNQEPKLIALTFDDGPNTYTTPKVLDLFEQYGGHASFFLIGDKINDDSAQVVKRAYDMGCEINSHSKTHPDMSTMTAEEIKAEMAYVDEYVFSIIGEYPKFFRPPYLNVSQTMYDNIDIPFVTGFSSGDSNSEKTAQERAETVLSYAKDGAIILMHDFYGNDKTVEALEIILPELQSQGYEFVTISELFERKGETPRKGMCYKEVQAYPLNDYVLSENLFSGSVSGDKNWEGWNTTVALDGAKLDALDGEFAIEAEYEGQDPPVVVLHRWKSSDDTLWKAVQPSYYNGSTACFLAEDLIAVLDEYGFTFADMTRINVRTYISDMTLTKADLLVKKSSSDVMGDVNDDGQFNVTDAAAMQKWLVKGEEGVITRFENGDFCTDGIIDVFDLCEMKKALVSKEE